MYIYDSYFLWGNDLFGHSVHISKIHKSIYFYVFSVCVYVCSFIYSLKPYLVLKGDGGEMEVEEKLRTILSEACKQFS